MEGTSYRLTHGVFVYATDNVINAPGDNMKNISNSVVVYGFQKIRRGNRNRSGRPDCKAATQTLIKKKTTPILEYFCNITLYKNATERKTEHATPSEMDKIVSINFRYLGS